MEDQVIQHISQLKDCTILEIVPFKQGVKKIYIKRILEGREAFGTYFCKDEGIIGKGE